MSGMCCEQLVCASCARPVAEARCSVCRAARAQMHGSGPTVSLALIAVAVTVLLAAAALLYGHLAA
jgi:hypothetical protein